MPLSNNSYEPEITPLERLGEYRVESEDNPGTFYMIDLFDYDGEGSCTCADYCYRIQPMREANLKPVHEFCKHINRAYAHAGRDFVRALLVKIKSGQFKRH